MSFIRTPSLILCFIVSALAINVVSAGDTTLIDIVTLPYSIKTVASDSTGKIWISGARGLQYYDFKKATFITSDPTVNSEIVSENGEVVKFSPSKGKVLYPWHEHDIWLSKIPPGHNRVSVARDKFGRYWVSTGRQFFIFSIENRFTQILSGNSTRGIYQEGKDLYVHTYLSGILKNGQPLFDKPSFAEGEIKKIRESLYFVWGGLIRYNLTSKGHEYLDFNQNKNASQTPLKNPRPQAAQNLHHINDTIWVGTNFGLGYIDQGSVIMRTNYPNIEDLIYFKGGLLVAGQDLIKPRHQPSPDHNLEDPGCENCRGIYLMQNKQFKKLNFPDYNYYQILEIGEHYYFASDSGLVIWDGDQDISVITKDEGLTDNRICTMALDGHGYLWVSTFSGLNRINISNGKINQYLNNVEFNYRSVFQNDSMIYMGGVSGIHAFHPKDFLGDDIDPRPLMSIKQIILFTGTGFILLMCIIILFLRKHFRRQLLRKEEHIREIEKRSFLLQIENVVFSMRHPPTVKTLSEAMKTSERSMYRSFNKYDLTPGAFIKELRLKKIKFLLKDSDNIDELKKVADQVGYSEQYLLRLLKTGDHKAL